MKNIANKFLNYFTIFLAGKCCKSLFRLSCRGGLCVFCKENLPGSSKKSNVFMYTPKFMYIPKFGISKM